jgi:hypothetical protein
MTESRPAIGVVHNGHVWDGTRWNPAPSQTPQDWPPPTRTDGGGFALVPSAFADPRYAYGLTQRAAKDIHFLARFGVVLAWIWMIGVGLSLIWGILVLVGLAAGLQTASHLPR